MKLLITILTLVLFFNTAAIAQAHNMEQCKVVDKDGNSLIREGQADSGYNIENDDDAWIWVPAGQCAKINAGDLSGVSQEVRSKLHQSYNLEAETIE